MSKITEALALLRKHGAAPIKLPTNPHSMAALRHETKEKLHAMIDAVQKEGRDFTTEESASYDAGMDVVKACSGHLDAMAYGRDNRLPIPVLGQGEDFDSDERVSLAEWMRNPAKYSVDTPLRFGNSTGFDSAVITEVESAVPTYYANDAFRLAGATIYNTDNIRFAYLRVISSVE
jgi:hypothetical protein